MKTTTVQMFGHQKVRRFALPILISLLLAGCGPKEAPVAQAIPAPAMNGGTSPTSTNPPSIEIISSKEILIDGNFENAGVERKEPQPDPKTRAQINGLIESGWWDNSNWGPVVANYALDTENPHGGKYSQKIEFVKLADTTTFGQIQFVQRVMVVQGQPYRASIWIRASAPEVPIEFGIQNSSLPYNTKMTMAKIGTEWRKLEHSLTPNPGGEKYFMVAVKKPGVTVWVDDAKLDTVSGTK